MKRIIFSLIIIISTLMQTEAQNDGIYGKIYTTKGVITINLNYQEAPVTVCNFVGLAEGTIKNTAKPEGTPYYDKGVFHRVVPGFVIQGGDPQGTGMGGPGYQFNNEITNLKHDAAGVVAMANAGPNTNGSQFYITLAATPHLDGGYSVFGKVVDGLNVVQSIEQGDKIDSIRIERVGKDAKKFATDDAAFAKYQADLKAKASNAEKAEMQDFEDYVKKNFPGAKRTDSGLYYIITQEGNGTKAEKGQTVLVHYNGTFTDGKKFDSSYDRGEPLSFPLGMGRVIKGWDEGIALLSVGGKAKLIIPYQLAYGKNGYPGAIPPKSTLLFDVELVGIQ